jgi:hypothetical protein
MAIIQSGATSTSLLTVDPTFTAARTSDHPPEVLGAYSIGVQTGAVASLAANGTLFSFRWSPSTSTQLCMVRRVEIGAYVNGAVTTSQQLSVVMTVARSWTVNDSVGTSVLFTQTNSQKQRTSMPVSAFASGGDIRVPTTAVNTAGTRTLDTNAMAQVFGTTGTAAGTTIFSVAPIFQHSPGDYPLIFAANEGFVINNGPTALATGSASFIINVEWMELNATTGNAIAY